MKPYKYTYFYLFILFPYLLSGQALHNSVKRTVTEGWLILAQTKEKDLAYDSAEVFYSNAIQHLSLQIDSEQPSLLLQEYEQTRLQFANLLIKNSKLKQGIRLLHEIETTITNTPAQDSLLGDVYYSLAEAQGLRNDFWDALRNYRKAIPFYIANTEHEKLAKTYTMIGTSHQNLGDFKKAMHYYDLAASILRLHFSDQHPSFSIIYNNMGVVHAKLANYKQALSYFKKTQQIDELKEKRNKLDIAGSYHNLGALYYLENDEERALEYLDRALQINTEELGEQHVQIGRLYNDIGLIYRSRKQYEDALSYFQRALHIYLKKATAPNQDIIEVHHNIALLYTEQKEYELALKKMKETLKMSKKFFPKEHFEFGKLYSDLGNIYFLQKNYRKAIPFYEQATPLLRKNIGEHHPEVIQNYNRLGEVYAAKGKAKHALLYYQRAIQSAVPSFLSKNIYDNPKLDTLDIQLKYNLLNSLHQKAKTFYLLYLDENRKDHLLLSYQTHQLVVTLLDKIRTDSDSEGAREKLINQITGFYEAAVRINFVLYEKDKQDKYLKNAFTIIEKSKSTLLLEGIRDSEAKRYAGVDKELLAKEEELRIQLSFYKDRLNRLQNDTEALDSILISEKVIEYRDQHEELLAFLKEKHPKYYDYKYQSPDIKLNKIQRFLKKDDLLLEYMWGGNTLYTIGITKTGIQQQQQLIDSTLIQTIKRYKSTFEQYQTNLNDDDYKKQIAQFKADAYYLYQRLVMPILEPLSETTDIQNLIIIPDNYLGYLSFETLLSTQPKPQDNYLSLPYLLRDYNIRYDYSTALLLLVDKKRELGRWVYMGFAPSYPEKISTSARQREVEALKNNQPEVKDIRWQVGGHHVLGKEASEANFKKRAEDYRILHLAMHAFADDNNPKQSRLVFANTNDPIEDDYLHVYELYNMNLKAELAVLSACDTGNGQIHPGEGVISLARAFKFAGCSNIVMSLWKASDGSTKDIMVNFYQNLYKGEDKSIALRKAKLDYLDNPSNVQNAHPFFWATFVLIGNDTPVEMGYPFRLRYLVYGFGFILFLGFYVFWEKKVVKLVLDAPVPS